MAEVLSASAKKRLAKKARDEAHAGEAAPAPASAPAAKSAAAKPAAAPAKSPANPPAAAKPAAAKAAAPKGEPFCLSCGTQFQAGANFCQNCGAKRPAADGAKAAAKAGTPAKAKAEPAPAKAAAAAAPPAEPKAPSKKAQKAAKAAANQPPPAENLFVKSWEDDGAGGWDTTNDKSKQRAKQAEKIELKKAEAEAEAAKRAAEPKKSIYKAAPAAKPEPKEEKKPPKKEKLVSAETKSSALSMIARIEEEAASKARERIEAKAASQAPKGRGKGKGKKGEDGDAPEPEPLDPNFVTAAVTVPSNKMGRIIGPGGKTLKMIIEKTGIHDIDTKNDVATIIGLPEPVKLCEVAVKEMIEKGYMSMLYENFTEDTVMVHPEHFTNLIGQRAVTIRKIKDELKVEVNIPNDIKKDDKGKYGKEKYPVSVAGSAANVETCKQVINDICYFKHHPTTHPGKVHEELEVPDWAHRHIIGPKGSEIRHIQNTFKVEVNIPREGNSDIGACPNVLLIGKEDGVKKARAHIEEVIHKAENAKKPEAKESKEAKEAKDDKAEEAEDGK